MYLSPREELRLMNEIKIDSIWDSNLDNIKHQERRNAKPLLTVIDMGKLLLQCARDGDINKVHELIARGAPFTTDWLGMSALHFAAVNNKYEVCEILLRGGINKDAKTKVDKTPLHLATYEGHEDIVKLLVLKNCDINATDMLRMTPLHWAIERQHSNIARLLIKSGADVTAASKFNKTPISMAIASGQTDLLTELEAAKLKQLEDKAGSSLESHENQTETNQAVKSIIPKSGQQEKYEAPANKKDTYDEKNELKSYSADRTIDSPEEIIEEDSNYLEPIVQLEHMEDSDSLDPSTLELLKCHGISMLPTDDSDNNLITSALESGRKLVLSEAGKLFLNETRIKQISDESSNTKSEQYQSNRELKKSPVVNRPPIVVNSKGVHLKPSKNIKIISMETFKRLYGPEMMANLKKAQNVSSKSTIPAITKITKISDSNNSQSYQKKLEKILSNPEFKLEQQNAKIVNIPKVTCKISQSIENNEDLPPNIEICPDSDIEDNSNVVSLKKEQANRSITCNILKNHLSSKGLQVTYRPSSKVLPSQNTPVESAVGPVLDLPELTRQLYELRKRTDHLSKQFELTHKENEEYKIRLERLERLEKERERDKNLKD